MRRLTTHLCIYLPLLSWVSCDEALPWTWLGRHSQYKYHPHACWNQSVVVQSVVPPLCSKVCWKVSVCRYTEHARPINDTDRQPVTSRGARGHGGDCQLQQFASCLLCAGEQVWISSLKVNISKTFNWEFVFCSLDVDALVAITVYLMFFDR